MFSSNWFITGGFFPLWDRNTNELRRKLVLCEPRVDVFCVEIGIDGQIDERKDSNAEYGVNDTLTTTAKRLVPWHTPASHARNLGLRNVVHQTANWAQMSAYYCLGKGGVKFWLTAPYFLKNIRLENSWFPSYLYPFSVNMTGTTEKEASSDDDCVPKASVDEKRIRWLRVCLCLHRCAGNVPFANGTAPLTDNIHFFLLLWNFGAVWMYRWAFHQTWEKAF